MGGCQTSTTGGEFQDSNMQAEAPPRSTKKNQSAQNPFFETDAQSTNGQNPLDNFNFYSSYTDKFIG